MNLIDKAFLLKKTSLFNALDLDLLLTISDHMEVLKYKENEKVFQPDQAGNKMFFIVEGSILVQDKENQFLAELQAGEFFGDESLFNEKPRTYQAICLNSVTLLALTRSHLLGIIIECPTVALALLEAYSSQTVFRKR